MEKLKIEDRVKNFARAIKEGATPEDSFEYEPTETGLRVRAEGREFDVTGNKRVQVTEHKEKKTRAKKEPAQDAEVECEKCHKLFVRSRFLPYMKLCKDCRKGTMVATGEKKVCKKCGKSFAPSKFNPYLETCPECREAARKARLAAKKPKKVAKVKTTKKEAAPAEPAPAAT